MVSNSWFYFQEYVVLGLPFRVQKKKKKKKTKKKQKKKKKY